MNDQPARPKPPPARPMPPPAQSPPLRATPAKPALAQAVPKPGGAPRATPRRLSAQEELEILIRARYPVIYVVSWEEERVER